MFDETAVDGPRAAGWEQIGVFFMYIMYFSMVLVFYFVIVLGSVVMC